MNRTIRLVAAAAGAALLIGVVVGLATSAGRRRPVARPAAKAVTARPAPPEPAWMAAGRPPKVWAVVVGVDRYDDPEIPPCRGAEDGARSVSRWLAEVGGWGRRDTLTLGSEGPAEHPESPLAEVDAPLSATRTNLDWAVRSWLRVRARKGDAVVVYFAGQAATVSAPARNPDGAPAGRTLLLPADAVAARLDATGWAVEDALDDLGSAGGCPVVVWLDTSPRGRGSPGVAPRGPAAPSADAWLGRIARWPGMTAWLASAAGPSAEGTDADPRSPFAAALVRALGTRDRARNLYACLGRLGEDPAAAAGGFRSLGGVDPALMLRSGKALAAAARPARVLTLQRGHADRLSSILVSADGSRMFTASRDSTVKSWQDGKVLLALPSHTDGALCLALDPEGRYLASGGGSGWLRVQDLGRDRDVPAEKRHSAAVEQVEFLGDSGRLVTLDADGLAKVWALSDLGDPPRDVADLATGLARVDGDRRAAFALARADGKATLHDVAGARLEAVNGPGGGLGGRIASAGRFLALGDDKGGVLVRDLDAGADVLRVPPAEGDEAREVEALDVSADGLLAYAAGGSLHLARVSAGRPAAPAPLKLAGTASRVVISRAGPLVAAATTDGVVAAWDATDAEHPRPIDLAGEAGAAEVAGKQATCLAFSADGKLLIAGDQYGGIRSWAVPDGVEKAPIPPRRGKVEALSASADGRHLLQVDHDGVARVWDLAEGRSVSALPGRWVSGALFPDGRTLALVGDDDGTVVRVDRATGLPLLTAFPRRTPDGQHAFGLVAVSPDGTRIAAGGRSGPIVCVWDANSGALIRAIRKHRPPGRVTVVAFSADSARLLTAAEDGSAHAWDLADPGDAPAASVELRDDDGRPVAATAACLDPTEPGRLAVGGRDGRIELRGPGVGPADEQPRAPVRGDEGVEVHALAFSADGRYLAAALADRALWLAESSRPRLPLRFSARHDEQANALIAWPATAAPGAGPAQGARPATLFASGGDDTTVRFWNPADRSLLGTLSAAGDDGAWVAFTPDGLFDASPGGEAQVTWVDEGRLHSLDQLAERSRVFWLADELRRGTRPRPVAAEIPAPPRLSIEPPAAPVAPARRLELTIAAAEPGLVDLRLYQNGIPVSADSDLVAAPGGRRWTATVALRSGRNRFYVMAGRPGGVDGRSEEVEVRFRGEDDPGLLHVVSLGVSRYDDAGRMLQFADKDAERIGTFLHENGTKVPGRLGTRISLVNDDVTPAKVEAAFATIRDAVRGRPQDTVVAFMAGHADALDGRFYLLLPGFPFREADLARRQGKPAGPAPKEALAYAAVYRNISRLQALQRLVVVDACQSESILDDPGVRQIRDLIDGGSRKARTSYIFAARRGEPAGESSELRHGLMTYVLLKGMGDPTLEPIPPGMAVFDDLPTADRDLDGTITSRELAWYADLALPRLASNFPLLVQRAGVDGLSAPTRPTANLNQTPRVQHADPSFPIIAKPAEVASPSAPTKIPATLPTGGG